MWINTLILMVVRCLLRLRYRVRVKGIEAIRARGKTGILFLPNHPALIDPIIMGATLYGKFAPRFLADQRQIDRPVIRWIARRIGVRGIPDVARAGAEGRSRIEAVIGDCVEGLRRGENLVMYPAGRTYRGYLESLVGTSAAGDIIKQVPGVRVVLVRTKGLWGSGFSWAHGREPHVMDVLKHGVLRLLASGIFFAPRREVSIELIEPDDLPREADRETLNGFMETFYNQHPMHNTYVPYSIWERGDVRRVPEPEFGAGASQGDVEAVPDATRRIVVDHLAEMSGVADLTFDMRLAHDLGLDSLARADLIVWVESEFGFPAGDADSLQTVGDVMLAACGRFASRGHAELKPVSSLWFTSDVNPPRVAIPSGDNLAEVFLQQARKTPAAPIVADQIAGVKSYRDLVTAILFLKREIERLPGERVGILLPASVAAVVSYLATLFSGKTPVMVNWTAGERNIAHSLEVTGVKVVLTAQALLQRLEKQGVALGGVGVEFVFLEEIARKASIFKKLWAWVRAHLSWSSLANVKGGSNEAVILFTSGSESLPKAVPLTHANLLANIRDLSRVVRFTSNDHMIGMLPPFHSFGLTATMLMPLCAGMPVVYHANPTEASVLARLIEAYKVAVLIGTPTFLSGILRAASNKQLASLRLAVTGAEKCGERVYAALGRQCPNAVVLEGYGITECSPVVSVNDESEPKAFTIGKPLPSLEHVLVDPETGKRVSTTGEAGMLLVRGPNVFSGYIAHAGQSPFVTFEGKEWYRTGDLVAEDEDGVFTFKGRLKRFVKLGGEMISLPAIEAVLDAHFSTGTEEGPVIAVEATPDEESPEVVLFTALPTDRETVNRLIRDAGLSPIHNVRRVIVREELPVLGTGKTDYRALRASLAEERAG